jgi:hypothetical protein
MGRDIVRKLREQVEAQTEELERLKMTLAEQAQKETELTRLLQRSAREKQEVEKQLDIERMRLNGFQLELQARHYELPYMLAQIEALTAAGQWPESVSGILNAISYSLRSIVEFTNGHMPTLDPATWLVLTRKLGVAANYLSRRQPALDTSSSRQVGVPR